MSGPAHRHCAREGSRGFPGDAVVLRLERRDLDLRARREAIAAWFDLHPRQLASLAPEVVDVMAARLADGDTLHVQLAELQASVRRWVELAETDMLTGLANRRVAATRLAQEAERASRYGRPLAVLLADVDGLKAINDQHGHVVGDVVLRELSSRLSRVMRGADLLARWAGDEFLVICPETDADAAALVADKLVRVAAAESVIAHGAADVFVGLSVGWAMADGELSVDRLVEAADVALYRSKNDGRGRASGPG